MRMKVVIPLIYHWYTGVLKSVYTKQKMPLMSYYAISQIVLLQELCAPLFSPLGKVQKPPSDKLDSKVAQIIQQPSETRDRIGKGQFSHPVSTITHGLMEEALLDILAAEPLFETYLSTL